MNAINVKCEKCDIDFLKRICHIKRRKLHFCSKQCSDLYRTGKLKNSVEVKCSSCNTPFFKQLSAFKKTNNHYCSPQCQSSHRTTKVSVNCTHCNSVYFIKKNLYTETRKNYFCSLSCYKQNKSEKKIEVECLICEKKFFKYHCKVLASPRHCCSVECAKILKRTKKDWGSNRSKLEMYVEERLKKDFNLKFLFNEAKIGYELDIHIPELNSAIEINGITHYKPIYGENILKKKIEIDQNKADECKKQNIELSILNVSEDKNYPYVLERRYNEIKKLILKRIKITNYISDKQLSLEL